jgi:hypothetical protein
MKNLEDALKEIHPTLTIYRLYKDLGGSIGANSLYKIANDPEINMKLSTASLIFDVTKNKYGRGLRPWDYLISVQDWTDYKKTFKN